MCHATLVGIVFISSATDRVYIVLTILMSHRESYSSADISFFNQEVAGVKIWKHKKRGAYYDRTLGFNPKCIP